jgi:hypothetical protein
VEVAQVKEEVRVMTADPAEGVSGRRIAARGEGVRKLPTLDVSTIPSISTA